MERMQFGNSACVQCRKAHRKCDKKLPACSECVCRGLGNTCTFAAPKKRGPRYSIGSNDSSNVASPTTSNNMSSSSASNTKKRANSDVESESLSTTALTNVKMNYQWHYMPDQGSKQRRMISPRLNNQNGPFNSLQNVDFEASNSNEQNVVFKNSETPGFRFHLNDTQNFPQIIHSTRNSTTSYSSSSGFHFHGINEQVPFDINQVESVSHLNFRLHTAALLDYYYEFLGITFPLLDRQYMENVVMSCINSKNELTVNNPEEEHILALLFAIQAVTFQQMAKRKLAVHTFCKSRDLIGRHFDYANVSYPIAASMAVISYYLIGQGDFIRADFYIQNTRIYLEYKKNRQRKTKEDEILFKFSKYCQFLLNDANILEQILCLCPVLYREFLNVDIDTSIIDINSPIEGQIDTAMNLINNISQSTFKCLNKKIQENKAEGKHLSIMKLTYDLVFLGLKLKLLSDNPLFLHNSKTIADQISNLLSSPLLNNCSILILEAVIYSATFHMKERDTFPNLLRLELNALNSMAHRFDIITSKYAHILSGLEERLRSVDNSQSFSLPIPSLPRTHLLQSSTSDPFNNTGNIGRNDRYFKDSSMNTDSRMKISSSDPFPQDQHQIENLKLPPLNECFPEARIQKYSSATQLYEHAKQNYSNGLEPTNDSVPMLRVERDSPIAEDRTDQIYS
jgi:hypothetical protein